MRSALAVSYGVIGPKKEKYTLENLLLFSKLQRKITIIPVFSASYN
jgi:hypothetical protein